ncbi:MAG: molybdopterin molybdotransferase MoeA [Acidobacteriota bacterium]|nr:molybdopterin molybdotransferase MoeA [Acidobacteriota bacterium]
MATLTFDQARSCVLQKVATAVGLLIEQVPLLESNGRVLASTLSADRDYPPLARSVRDGFAIRSSDVPGSLTIAGEVRAGEASTAALAQGEAIEIMTGAPVPAGADSVVMVEHTVTTGNQVRIDRSIRYGENISPRGSEAQQNQALLAVGQRIGYTEIALLATCGHSLVDVFRHLNVAIVATGDEILDVPEQPADHQIRNSNAWSLAAQVVRAGASPNLLPVARDVYDQTRELIERGLESDLLLLSGGVSAGKYDIVERVLADLGAEFFFDRVLIQPGQPLVFGQVRGKFFFGLPGNPASTMVTFEVFARAALELLSGQRETTLPITWARLTRDFQQKPGLTRFLPASLDARGLELTPVPWKGSADVPAMTRANAYLVTEPDRERWQAGDMIHMLPK